MLGLKITITRKTSYLLGLEFYLVLKLAQVMEEKSLRCCVAGVL
jgi:hypothetical protein